MQPRHTVEAFALVGWYRVVAPQIVRRDGPAPMQEFTGLGGLRRLRLLPGDRRPSRRT